jgi:uncharacterized protein YjiS (DUF1127 family)
MEDIITLPVNSWVVTPGGALRGAGRWYREKRVAMALEALNDATLKDIGICRCEIPWIARNRAVADET